MAGPVLLVVACEAGDVDELAAHLWAAGTTGILERDTPDGPALVAGFASAGDAALAADDLDHRFTYEVVEADDRWLDAWREHAQAWRAGEHLVVVPPWVDHTAGAGDLVIVLDPGRAFGSGSHESTRLALAALEQVVRPGDAVLDVGCGSGVLAIAAALLGAGAVTAVDVDPEAVAATRANADRNGVALTVEPGSAADVAGRFDVVVANLLIGVQRVLAPALDTRVAPGGTLVISGLLTTQLDGVVARHGPARAPRRMTEGDWSAAILRSGG